MFSYVKKVIFEENEPKKQRELLEDYNHLVSNLNFPKFERQSFLKALLQKEFREKQFSITDFKIIKAVSFMMAQKEETAQNV